MGGEEEGKKSNNKQHDDHSDIVVLCYFYILCNVSETVRGGRKWAAASLYAAIPLFLPRFAVIWGTRSQTQAHAGATEGLIVKVWFNKTVRFSLGGGGGVGGEAGLSEDHRRSVRKTEARGVSRRMKAEQAQQREMFTELSTPKIPGLIAAFLNSARSSSRCAAGHFASAPASCAALRQTENTHPRPCFFDSSRVGLAHDRTCRETWKEIKENPVNLKKKNSRARYNPTRLGLLLRGRRRNYWKTRENASNNGKKRK